MQTLYRTLTIFIAFESEICQNIKQAGVTLDTIASRPINCLASSSSETKPNMSNNRYTSPSVYASRGYKPKYKTKRTYYEQGMGYALETLPPGMSRSEFKKLYSTWEKKLKDSDFYDIEYRSPSHTGHFTPFFKRHGSSATFQRLYDSSKEEYYALARSFECYMSERAWFQDGETLEWHRVTRWTWCFEQEADVYKTLWRLHLEGVPYRAVAKAFSGIKTHWMKGVKQVPPRLQQPRSVFWAHDHTHKILDLFWKWAQDTEGLKDPR